MRKIASLPAVLLLVLAAPLVALAQPPSGPERFESSIRRFEIEDETSRPPEGAIVLTGSSSIARWNDQAVEALAPLTVIPRGFGGSVMSDVLHYLDRVALKYKPRALLIYEGDNDTWLSVPNGEILRQLEEIIARVHAELPGTRIYVLSVKPSVSRWSIWPVVLQLNRAYQELAERNPFVHYVDVATPFLDQNDDVRTDVFVSDDLHLNDRGNEIWGATIKAALMPHEIAYE